MDSKTLIEIKNVYIMPESVHLLCMPFLDLPVSLLLQSAVVAGMGDRHFSLVNSCLIVTIIENFPHRVVLSLPDMFLWPQFPCLLDGQGSLRAWDLVELRSEIFEVDGFL